MNINKMLSSSKTSPTVGVGTVGVGVLKNRPMHCLNLHCKSLTCIYNLTLVLQWSCLQQDQDFSLVLEARPRFSQAGIETKTKTSVVKSQVKTKTFTKPTRAVLIFKTMVSRQQDWLLYTSWVARRCSNLHRVIICNNRPSHERRIPGHLQNW